MKVLITGGTGFLGRAVAKTLCAQADMQVCITARRPTSNTVHQLDVLAEVAALTKALRGVQGVAHCVAGNEETTLKGTQNLLEACSLAKVQRVVLISSIAVYGQATGLVNEESPCVPAGRHNYASWKVQVEEMSRHYSGLEVVILRPTIIYGPDSPLWVTGIERRIKTGYWGTFAAAGMGSCNLVHVDDVAEAVRKALITPSINGQIFNINGPTQVTWNEWFQKIADIMGYGVLPVIAPKLLHMRTLLALPFKAIRKITGIRAFQWVEAVPAFSELRLFRLKAVYSTNKAERALNWKPQISLHDGLKTLSPLKGGF